MSDTVQLLDAPLSELDRWLLRRSRALFGLHALGDGLQLRFRLHRGCGVRARSFCNNVNHDGIRSPSLERQRTLWRRGGLLLRLLIEILVVAKITSGTRVEPRAVIDRVIDRRQRRRRREVRGLSGELRSCKWVQIPLARRAQAAGAGRVAGRAIALA